MLTDEELEAWSSHDCVNLCLPFQNYCAILFEIFKNRRKCL